MSLNPLPVAPVPASTAKIAQAAFRKGNLYMKLRDELGTLFTDEDFASLYPTRGQPALEPWRLALVARLRIVCGAGAGRRRVGQPAGADAGGPIRL